MAHFRRSERRAELLKLCPGTSDVDFFRNLNGVIDLNTEVSDRALDFGVAQRLGFILRVSYLIESQRSAARRLVLAAVRRSCYRELASRTKADYMGKIELIEKEFGTLPLAALTDRRTRGVFREWRDKLARSSRRQADYAFAVLSLVLAWALEGGFVDANPCTRMGRLYGEARTDKIWNEKDEANFNARVVG